MNSYTFYEYMNGTMPIMVPFTCMGTFPSWKNWSSMTWIHVELFLSGYSIGSELLNFLLTFWMLAVFLLVLFYYKNKLSAGYTLFTLPLP
jgi:hypothetical protein